VLAGWCRLERRVVATVDPSYGPRSVTGRVVSLAVAHYTLVLQRFWPSEAQLAMPTAFEMRKKNQQFAARARAGKPIGNPSMKDKLSKRTPVGITVLVLLFIVLLGGGVFELLRLFF